LAHIPVRKGHQGSSPAPEMRFDRHL